MAIIIHRFLSQSGIITASAIKVGTATKAENL